MIVVGKEQGVYMDIGKKNNMTVKQLYRKYKGYDIMIFGVPLDKPSTPFTRLPKDKKLDDCIVKDIKIDTTKVKAQCFGLNLDYKGIKEYKGTVYVYVI